MKRLFFLLLAYVLITSTFAQESNPSAGGQQKKIYQETPEKINNLIHTKLEVKPDFSKSYLYGKAWITLKPHFYPTDSLTLDAKGMEFRTVAIIKGTKQLPLKYEYNDWQLKITLDRTYSSKESYTIYIDYTAKPDEFQKKYDKNSLLGIKGLYFINPRGEEKDKPAQIWTQGETESSSAWFPTIDKPNQKTTQELSVTVPAKYVTLSNGKLVSQKKNTDGTRTDYWKMDLPHTPYLFFLGVGEYAVIKDNWRGKEVSYYVEPEYAPVAKRIFGNTPEMMTYFSRITGVDYPWVKYSQITGRDYISGAMENTTATLHSDLAQQDARELVDGNNWEAVIAHELFHHWFGDYVTTESWSNLTVNESFADYSQTLWDEYKYGKDAGDAENYQGMQGYLNGSAENIENQGGNPESGTDKKDLVRFYYTDKEEMFDAVSYQKGGRILHMLRNFVGDSAFFKSLNLYLTTNKFKAAEAHQLRLAFEEVTGKDLNWFFNQWYFSSGHPKLDIDYQYNDAEGKVNVIIRQTQKGSKIFKLPVAIDIYTGEKKTRYRVWAENRADTFTFKYTVRPDLINVDGDKILLAEKNDKKTLENFIHQYTYAGNYMDRREAIEFAAQVQKTEPKALELLKKAAKDKYHGLRNLVLNSIDMEDAAVKSAFEPILLDLAKNDKKSTVRGNAISLLGEYEKKEYAEIFKKAVYDSSYTISGHALEALMKIDEPEAFSIAKELSKKTAKGVLQQTLITVIAKSGDESMADKLIGDFAKMPLGQAKFNTLQTMASYLAAIKNTEKVKWGVEEIVKFRDAIPEQFKVQTDPFINGFILKPVLTRKEALLKTTPDDKALQELIDYLKAVQNPDQKKGF